MRLPVPEGRLRIEVSNTHPGPVHLGLQVFDSETGELAALIPMRLAAGECRRIAGMRAPREVQVVPIVTPAEAAVTISAKACRWIYARLRDLTQAIGLDAVRRSQHTAPMATPRWLDSGPLLKTGTKISVIIPTRDRTDLLRQAVATAYDGANWSNRELIIVDNGSVEDETVKYLKSLARREDITVVRDDRPFNFSQLINTGTAAASGDVFVFLNNDVIGDNGRWLERMSGWAMKRGVGAVGALLTFPNGRIQHAGIKVGAGGLTDHVLLGQKAKGPYTERPRRVDAVTGACFATSRRVFEALGGFEEDLAVEMNDVDYCLRAEKAGLTTVLEPGARLVHLESQSRGAPTPSVLKDRAEFIRVWGERILKGAR